MAYQIVFSQEALEKFTSICDYIENNYSETVLTNFLQNIDSKLNLLANFPLMYPIYAKDKNIRRCVVNKQTSIYYKILPRLEEIQIVTLFDNQQNPKDLDF